MHDELEGALRELFERQVEAMGVNTRAWDDPPLATVSPSTAPRRSRSAMTAVLATAAAVALVVAVVAIIPARSGVYIGGQPGSPAEVHFATKHVSLSADNLSIDARGHHFTAAGSTIDVNSDPGTPDKYTTLELVWTERGVEMRLNIYFTSDGHDWWANEIRTYNGKSPGDWIDYQGEYFRSRLGSEFAGDVDLAATDSDGHLHFSNLRLQPFLPPAICNNATTRYAFDIAYSHVDMPNVTADGFGIGTPTLLDTTTCAPVTDTHAFVYSLALTPTGVAGIAVGNDQRLNSQYDIDPSASIQLATAGAAGTATLRLTASRRIGGQVVATADIPITVG